jgi:hypothetical protein
VKSEARLVSSHLRLGNREVGLRTSAVGLLNTEASLAKSEV